MKAGILSARRMLDKNKTPFFGKNIIIVLNMKIIMYFSKKGVRVYYGKYNKN